MKICKKAVLLLLAALLLVCTVMPAFAAEDINPNHSIRLTLHYFDVDNTPIVGAKFSIYQAATVDKTGKLTVTKEFAGYNVNIPYYNDNEAWKSLATTLEGFVLRDKLSPTDTQTTNEQGQAVFPSNDNKKLMPGLYLVLGTRYIKGEVEYETLPFMITMPMQDESDDEWNYDVSLVPKYESRSEFESAKVDCKVLKVWDDKGNEASRPKGVVVQLLRDGEIYDTVTLNAANNWRYKWSNLDAIYQWRVVEKELDDYTVSISREGVTFVITNTCTKEIPSNPSSPSSPTNPNEPSNPTNPVSPSSPSNPSEPNNPTGPGTPNDPTLPQTGQLWWPVPMLAAGGLLMIIIGLMCVKGRKDEEN